MSILDRGPEDLGAMGVVAEHVEAGTGRRQHHGVPRSAMPAASSTASSMLAAISTGTTGASASRILGAASPMRTAARRLAS